jgi:hypothetical protein
MSLRTSRFREALPFLLAISLSSVVRGDERPVLLPHASPGGGFGVIALDGSAAQKPLRFIAGPATPEPDVAWSLARSHGRGSQGGGGDVSLVDTVQTTYETTMGDVLVIWRETTENVEGVNVFQDGNLLGNVPGLPADQLPRTRAVLVEDVAVGVHVYRVEGGGTSGEKSQDVVAAQPFADPSALACTTGDFRDPENGTCQMEASWTVNGAAPTEYALLFDGTQIGNLDGAERDATINGVPPGNHCISLVGFLFSPQGGYRGASVESCCDIACEDTSCDPLGNLLICQVEYGPTAAENLLRLEWDNGELPYAAGVTGYIDGAAAGTLPGDAEGAFVRNLTAGSHTIGVEGDCAANGKTPILEEMFAVLDETPHTSPISGSLVCTFDPAGPSTTVTWTPDEASAFVDVYVTRAPDGPAFVGSVSANPPGVRVNGTRETDVVGLQFFRFENDFCYGSDLISCGDGAKYIQGVCDGVGGTPQIGSAVFGLRYLFQSGDTPPCVKACDTDGDGNVVITDMVIILNFLFTGGPAPSLWVDSNGDSIPDPVCTQAGAADDCVTGSADC